MVKDASHEFHDPAWPAAKELAKSPATATLAITLRMKTILYGIRAKEADRTETKTSDVDIKDIALLKE